MDAARAAKENNQLDIRRVVDHFNNALKTSQRFDTPYRHWLMSDLFPAEILEELTALDFPVSSVGDLSGKREYHNDTRHYFDQDNISKHVCIAALAHAFQTPQMVRAIENHFSTDLEGTFLRIEYAQDTSGFWLEPHTDLGVKRLSMLIYFAQSPGQEALGTDIYDADKEWSKRAPFSPNSALAFVPSNNTYHGFERREIPGVRKSLILNYVTSDWRDREQLCFPHQTVTGNT